MMWVVGVFILLGFSWFTACLIEHDLGQAHDLEGGAFAKNQKAARPGKPKGFSIALLAEKASKAPVKGPRP